MRVALLLAVLSAYAAAHPLCFFDERPTDPDEVLTFCPAQPQYGACCNDAEEAGVVSRYNDFVQKNGPFSSTCKQYIKEVRARA